MKPTRRSIRMNPPRPLLPALAVWLCLAAAAAAAEEGAIGGGPKASGISDLRAREAFERTQSIMDPETRAAYDRWKSGQATEKDMMLLRRNNQQIQMEAHRGTMPREDFNPLQKDQNQWMGDNVQKSAKDGGLEGRQQKPSGEPKPGTDFDGLAAPKPGSTATPEQYQQARQNLNQNVNKQLQGQGLKPLENPSRQLETDIMPDAERVSKDTFRQVEKTVNRDGGVMYGDQDAARVERKIRDGEMPSVKENVSHLQEQVRQARSHNAESGHLIDEGRRLMNENQPGTEGYRQGQEMVERGQLRAEQGVKYEQRMQEADGRIARQTTDDGAFRPQTKSQGTLENIAGKRGQPDVSGQDLGEVRATSENRIAQRQQAAAQRLAEGGQMDAAAEIARNMTPSERGRLLDATYDRVYQETRNAMPQGTDPAKAHQIADQAAVREQGKLASQMRENPTPDRWNRQENRWELNSRQGGNTPESPGPTTASRTVAPDGPGGGKVAAPETPGGKPAASEAPGGMRGALDKAGKVMMGVGALNTGQDIVDWQDGKMSGGRVLANAVDNIAGGPIATGEMLVQKGGDALATSEAIEHANRQKMEGYALDGGLALRQAGVPKEEVQKIMADMRNGDNTSFDKARQDLAAKGIEVDEPLKPVLSSSGAMATLARADDNALQRGADLLKGIGHGIARAADFAAEATGLKAAAANVQAWVKERGVSESDAALAETLVSKGATHEEALEAIKSKNDGDFAELTNLRNRLNQQSNAPRPAPAGEAENVKKAPEEMAATGENAPKAGIDEALDQLKAAPDAEGKKGRDDALGQALDNLKPNGAAAATADANLGDALDQLKRDGPAGQAPVDAHAPAAGDVTSRLDADVQKEMAAGDVTSRLDDEVKNEVGRAAQAAKAQAERQRQAVQARNREADRQAQAAAQRAQAAQQAQAVQQQAQTMQPQQQQQFDPEAFRRLMSDLSKSLDGIGRIGAPPPPGERWDKSRGDTQ